MKREEDVFKIYNEILDSIDSSNDNNEKKESLEMKSNEFPKMPIMFMDNEGRPVILEEQTEEKKFLNLETEESPKENNKLKKKKNKTKFWVTLFSVLDSIAIICIFFMYGPISYFRNLWVTSAMTTMTHQYLAYIFFNEQQVKDIMSNNVVIEGEEDTNKDEIKIEEQIPEQIVYSSLEEELVLKKDEGNDLYKVIDIEGVGYKGHMLVVYDPSKIQLVQITNMKYGLTIDQFVNRYNAVAGINAGGFNYTETYGYRPTGSVIIDGQIISEFGTTGWGGGIVGFTNDNVLVLTKSSAQEAIEMGIRDAVSFGPFLIVNGVPSQFKGNGGYGIAPRTAIGQRKDGIVLMLVIDGRRPGHSLGVDMVELTNIMLKYGAYNASNLDGGGSSTIVVGTETLSVAGGSGYIGDRYLPNSWLIIP